MAQAALVGAHVAAAARLVGVSEAATRAQAEVVRLVDAQAAAAAARRSGLAGEDARCAAQLLPTLRRLEGEPSRLLAALPDDARALLAELRDCERVAAEQAAATDVQLGLNASEFAQLLKRQRRLEAQVDAAAAAAAGDDAPPPLAATPSADADGARAAASESLRLRVELEQCRAQRVLRGEAARAARGGAPRGRPPLRPLRRRAPPLRRRRARAGVGARAARRHLPLAPPQRGAARLAAEVAAVESVERAATIGAVDDGGGGDAAAEAAAAHEGSAGIATGAADDAHDGTASELHQALREAGAGSAELLGPLGELAQSALTRRVIAR